MKKLFAVALFSLSAAVLGTGSASAGWLRHLCCDHKCYLTIKCKQYNAFSPSAFGCVTFSPCCAQPNPCPGGYAYGPGCENGICGEAIVPHGVTILPSVSPDQPGKPATVPPPQATPPAGGPTGHVLPGQGLPFPAQPAGLGPNFPSFQGYPGYQGYTHGYYPVSLPQQWTPQYRGIPQGAYPGR